MLKRKTLTLCAVVLAILTIVGAGFSAWVFSTERRGDTGVGITIEYATTFGTVTGDGGPFKLVLDQGEGNKKNDTKAGVSLQDATKEVDSITATWNISKHSFDDAQVRYRVNIYVHTNTLGQYVKLSAASGFTVDASAAGAGEHKHADYTVYRKDLDADADIKKTEDPDDSNFWNVEMTLKVVNDMTNMFEYVENKKPSKFQLYQEMVSAIIPSVNNVNDVKHGQVYTFTPDKASDSALIIEFVVTNMGGSGV